MWPPGRIRETSRSSSPTDSLRVSCVREGLTGASVGGHLDHPWRAPIEVVSASPCAKDAPAATGLRIECEKVQSLSDNCLSVLVAFTSRFAASGNPLQAQSLLCPSLRHRRKRRHQVAVRDHRTTPWRYVVARCPGIHDQLHDLGCKALVCSEPRLGAAGRAVRNRAHTSGKGMAAIVLASMFAVGRIQTLRRILLPCPSFQRQRPSAEAPAMTR